MLQKKFEDFMKDIQANESRVTYINDLAHQLGDEGHPDIELISTKQTVRRYYFVVVPLRASYRASDISRGRGPAKFRYFRKIPRNSQKNAKYHDICQKYFQIHVSKTYLILILAFRPVLFTPNVQIYLQTSSLQRVNNIPKLPGVLRLMLRKTGH